MARLLSGFSVKDFSDKSSSWWDPESDFSALHQLNPLRMAFIEEQIALEGTKVLDVGCGGGILAESLCRSGARVTAIDLSQESIVEAQRHSASACLDITYRCAQLADLLQEQQRFGVVVCSEVVEHVQDQQTIVREAVDLCDKGGLIIFSTINKTLAALLGAKLAGEYILRLLPEGTHDPRLFLKPSALDGMLRRCGAETIKLVGISYEPWQRQLRFSRDPSINYLLAARKLTPSDE